MNKNLNELNPEELEQVAGGFVVGDQAQNKYGVIKQDGTLLAPAPSLEKAVEYAKAYNLSTTVLTPEEYKKRFARDMQW